MHAAEEDVTYHNSNLVIALRVWQFRCGFYDRPTLAQMQLTLESRHPGSHGDCLVKSTFSGEYFLE